MLDLHRLRLLREFAGRGTIAATAAALGYTASAVSQQLTALEREAGTALLDRAARSVELTDAGRRLAVHAEIILAQVEAAEADLSAQEVQPSGRVCVTAFASAAAAFAPALVRGLRRYPRLTLLLQQAAPGEGLRRARSAGAGAGGPLVQRPPQLRLGHAAVLSAGARSGGAHRAAWPRARRHHGSS